LREPSAPLAHALAIVIPRHAWSRYFNLRAPLVSWISTRREARHRQWAQSCSLYGPPVGGLGRSQSITQHEFLFSPCRPAWDFFLFSALVSWCFRSNRRSSLVPTRMGERAANRARDRNDANRSYAGLEFVVRISPSESPEGTALVAYAQRPSCLLAGAM